MQYASEAASRTAPQYRLDRPCKTCASFDRPVECSFGFVRAKIERYRLRELSSKGTVKLHGAPQYPLQDRPGPDSRTHGQAYVAHGDCIRKDVQLGGTGCRWEKVASADKEQMARWSNQ